MKKTIFTLLAFLSLAIMIGCTPTEVTVAFEENGGDQIQDLSVVQKTTMTSPTATRSGYTFSGWYEDAELTTLFDFDTLIVRNITLYAKWTINSYSLTFVLGNSDDDVVIAGDYNSTFTYPEDPERTGYDFKGWYLDEERTEEFTSNRIPSENTTVYASWQIKEYTVNFYTDSSTTPIYTEEVPYNEAVKNPPAIPVVTGMDGAWTEDISSITSDLDVYLEYTKQVYEITFKDYEGTVYDTLSVEYGDLITPPSTPSRVGYDFIGYYNAVLDINVDLSTYTVTSNLELQDKFQIKTFSVKFFGGEDGSLLGDIQFIDYGNAAVAPTAGFDRQGYTFTSWDVDFSNITDDLDVHAQYTINQYTASFNANGGVYLDCSANKDVTINYNSNLEVPELPIKAGFIFVGWYTELTYENEIYFGTGIPMPIGGLTVYAKWVELVATTYTVSGTYHFEQVGIASDNLSTDGIYTETLSESYIPFINVLYGSDISAVRDIEGYEFYKFVYNGQEYFDEEELVTINQDETIDVYYRRIVLSINFNEYINSENVTTTYYVYYNDSLTNVPTPTPVSGMTVAWERQNFDNIKASFSVTAIQYDNSLQTVIFMSNGTIIYMTTNEPNLSGVIDPHNVVITENSQLWNIEQQGYRFLGWYLTGTDTLLTDSILYFDDSVFVNNITYIEARWVALVELNEATDIYVDANPADEEIIISFDITPVTVNDSLVYPSDFIFILNGIYIESSDVLSDSLINYIARVNNTFTLTLTSTDSYYDFFKEILMSSEDNYATLIPGTHSLQIISVGDDVDTTDSNPSTSYKYEVDSIYDGIPESQTVKDYYIIEDFGNNNLRYIFYANLTYQFTGLSFDIETGSNHITANNNQLITSSIPGEFSFTITDESGSRTYNGLVVEDIRQFDMGSSYTNYLTQVNQSTEDNSFLEETEDYPYYVGANDAFYLDILIRDNNGARISLDDVILDYEFYLNDSLVALNETELEDYVVLEDNLMYFTNLAIGESFRIVTQPKYEATLMDMDAISFTVLINDGYNAFTNDDLKALYSDLNVNLINVHRNITAELYSNQTYEDGSPINYYATASNNYENYGNVYYRVNGNTDDDQITLEGNFMTIDGSNIEYINPDNEGFGNIIYAQGFDIVSTQIGIFYYNVYQSAPVNNNQFTMNNLMIIGNTTTPSVNYAGTEEEIYNQERLMSQNSGGMLGVIVRNGKASLNNLVIGYTVIGVTTNAYGENTNLEPMVVDLDYVSIYDSWANSIYLYGGSGVNIMNSSIGSSGGAAIHFEDTHAGITGYDDPILILDEATEINNWISGQEAWFKAYAMSSVALALKSSINGAINPLEKTIIQMIQNPVTGLNTEMINLVFLSLPKEGAVTISNPNDPSSVVTASEVAFDITDATGTTSLERAWDFTTQLWPLDATTAIVDPRVMDNQYGFALGSLSNTYAFLQMIEEIMTTYYGLYGAMMSQADAGNLATIAGFYNLTAMEALQVGGYMSSGFGIHEAITAIKGSLDYAQPRFIEVIAPIALTDAAGNATVLIEMFNVSE